MYRESELSTRTARPLGNTFALAACVREKFSVPYEPLPKMWSHVKSRLSHRLFILSFDKQFDKTSHESRRFYAIDSHPPHLHSALDNYEPAQRNQPDAYKHNPEPVRHNGQNEKQAYPHTDKTQYFSAAAFSKKHCTYPLSLYYIIRFLFGFATKKLFSYVIFPNSLNWPYTFCEKGIDIFPFFVYHNPVPVVAPWSSG